MFDSVCSFAPRISARIAGTAPPELVHAPVSSFGWHSADLRDPLPQTLEELREHPVGLMDGRQAYLCSESHLIRSRKMYASIEVSVDFTDHYNGERVYVCTL